MRRVAIACLLLLASSGFAQVESPDPASSVADILLEREELSTFAQMMRQTGILVDLGEPGVFTVFAPTNDAFAALDQEALAEIVEDQGVIELLLRHHIAMGGSTADALAGMSALTSISDYQYLITQDGDALFVDAARILTADLQAENGVVHVIDDVLFPELMWPRKNQTTIPAGGTSNDEE